LIWILPHLPVGRCLPASQLRRNRISPRPRIRSGDIAGNSRQFFRHVFRLMNVSRTRAPHTTRVPAADLSSVCVLPNVVFPTRIVVKAPNRVIQDRSKLFPAWPCIGQCFVQTRGNPPSFLQQSNRRFADRRRCGIASVGSR